MSLFRRVPNHAVEAHAEARMAQSSAFEANLAAERNEEQIERLLMITEALWRVVKQKHSLQDSDLDRLVEAIDLEDGFLDGRVRSSNPDACTSCQKTVTRNRTHCLYCGTPVEAGVFAR
jgi:hypothetical protein